MMNINQSTIKRVSSLSACPRRYYLERITKEVSSNYSDAMRNGNYFEWLWFGTKTRDGEVPVMPRLKNGNKSTDQIRIEDQVEVAKKMLKDNNILIAETDFAISEKFNEDITFEGLLDALGDWNSEPYIFDCKLTKDCTSTFGDFAWGKFDEILDAEKRIYIGRQTDDGMDLLQAYSYMFLMEKKTNVKFNFAYLVFDYKKVPEYKIIIVPYDQQQIDNAIGRLIGSAVRLESFADTNYPEIPTVNECKSCKAIECASRIDMNIMVANATPLATNTLLVQTEPIVDAVEERPW